MKLSSFLTAIWVGLLVAFLALIVARSAHADAVDKLSPSCFTTEGAPTDEEMATAMLFADTKTKPAVILIRKPCWPWPEYEAVYLHPKNLIHLKVGWRTRPMGIYALVHEMRHHRQAELGDFTLLGPAGRECDAYSHTAIVALFRDDIEIARGSARFAREFCSKLIDGEAN